MFLRAQPPRVKEMKYITQCNFNAPAVASTAFPFLSLHIGEEVSVISTSAEWCYGSVVGSAEKIGIFPMCTIISSNELLPSLPSEAMEVVVELTEALKEWWSTVKQTYGNQARMECQNEVLIYMEDLMGMRKKILSGNVPIEELKEMRLEVARKIDLGNQWLGLDMLIRDETGRKMDCDTASVVKIYRAHVDAANRILSDSKPNDTIISSSYSLLVQALSATIDSKSECEFTLSLYDIQEQRFITENFLFYWRFINGSLKNRKSKALFSDLGSRECISFPVATKEHRILLCIRVARIAPIEQSSSTLRKHIDPGPPQLWCRQPYASAVLDLSDVIASPNGSVERIIPLNREDSLEQLLARANGTRTSASVKMVSGDLSGFGRAQLMISVEVLNGTLAQIKKSQPQVFSSNPPIELHKLSFSDVMSADEVRNDLYFTMLHGDLHGGKGSDKNIEARITVVDSSGIVKDSFEIITADGVLLKTTYRSLVFYHEDKPRWNETVKVQIPEDIDQNIHLRIAFYYKKNYDKMKQEKGPFALAFARILEGATLIGDGIHELLVYKIESGRFDENDTSYTRLPSSRSELKDSHSQARPQITSFIHGDKNLLTIETVTCSTTLTHNKCLLDILRWKANRSTLKDRLEEISKPKSLAVGGELVKFIPNFCDAVFEILDQHPDYDSLVFDALVMLIQLVNEERYKNFRPVLDNYVENFHSTVAFVKIIPVLRDRIRSAEDTHERSLNTMKSLGTLIQLIVRSKICSDRLGLSSNSFQNLIRELLNEFVVFMQNKRVRMTCQNMALKHLPAVIPHLTYHSVYNSADLTDFLIRLMDHLGDNISPRCRLNFLKDIVETDHFVHEENRRCLLPKIVEKVVDELEGIDFTHVYDATNDKNKITESISASADVVLLITERLFCSPGPFYEPGSDDEPFLLISAAFRSVVQTTVLLIIAKFPATAFCALTITLLSKMSAQMYKMYIDRHQTRLDKHDLLMELVHLFRDLMNKTPFPSSWFHMILLQDRVVLKTMKFIMSTMIDHFHGEQFDVELWREYMLTMVSFCTQKALHLDSSTVGARRRRLLASQPDLRRVAVADLRSMWFRLSTVQKSCYVPSMIGSFLQVALVDDDVVRETVIPIFFDMMQCEFTSSPSRTFNKFANETIMQLDCLVDEDRGGEKFRDQLRNIMMSMCRSDSELASEGCRFVSVIDTLLQHLFEYREVRTNGYCIENGMDRTVELLKYYDLIGQPDLHINYVYKLYDLHMLSNNKIEAAFTLLKHAETLTWDNVELPAALLNAHLNRQCATQRQLKEVLFNEAANLFDEKELWEESVAILKELITEYERNYEFEKLPPLLRRLADLYHKISTQGRVGCTYYYVAFFGLGFPNYLNEQQFIHRGNECEAIGSFQHRMQSAFAGSQLINTMEISTHLSRSDGRYLQIFPVQPIVEENWENKCTNRLVKWYHRNNQVQKFVYSKGECRKGTKWTELEDSEIMRSWVVRRCVYTKESLPNILKWSQIITLTDPVECSPLMEAVTTMQKNNDEMEEMAHVVLSTPLESVVPLGGKIRGVVQAFVQGGIKNYKIFFTEKCASVLTTEEHSLVQHLERLIKAQVPILEFCLYAHASRDHQVDAAFHESLVSSFFEYKVNIERQFGKVPSKLPPGASVHLPSLLKGDDRRASGLDSISTPSVMSITGVFRRGGGATKSGRTIPRKSVGLKSDFRSTIENGFAKRISSSSDRSSENISNENMGIALRSTSDILRLDHPLKATSSASLFATDDDFSARNLKALSRTSDMQMVPPPLPPRPDVVHLLFPRRDDSSPLTSDILDKS